MDIALGNNETILRQGEANHYTRGFIIIGRLFLTNKRLVFVAHKVNFKQYTLEIDLDDIVEIKLRNNAYVFSHGFWVVRESATEEHIDHFSMWRRKAWKADIESAIEANA